MECVTFQEVTKFLDGEVNSEEFSVKCAVPSLSRGHLPGEEREWMPGTIDVLLKHGTNGCVGGIGHEAGGSV